MPPLNNEAPGDKAAGRSRFSSLFYVAAIGGKSPRTRQGVGLQLCTALFPSFTARSRRKRRRPASSESPRAVRTTT